MNESAGPSVEQSIYWEEFQQLKLACCYVRDYRNSIGKSETTVAAIRAIASSASIAAWAVWRRYAVVWASFIAASQVVDALRDVFPFRRRRQALSRWSNALNRQWVDAQRDWDNIYAGKVPDKKIRFLTHQLRLKMQRYEARCIPDGLVRKDDLFLAAEAEMAAFFQKRYSVNER